VENTLAFPAIPPSEPLLVTGLAAALRTDLPTETVTLSWHERRRVRQRVVSDRGTELCLALPRGTVLADAQVLWQDEGRQIMVRSQPELLLKIAPASIAVSCQVAHHLGNWHRPLQVLPEGILLAEADAPLSDWLQQVGIPFEEICHPFHPNLVSHSHSQAE
jgi:urease accessory protein